MHGTCSHFLPMGPTTTWGSRKGVGNVGSEEPAGKTRTARRTQPGEKKVSHARFVDARTSPGQHQEQVAGCLNAAESHLHAHNCWSGRKPINIGAGTSEHRSTSRLTWMPAGLSPAPLSTKKPS